MSDLYGGIDPGKKGFVAVVDVASMTIVKRWPQPLIAGADVKGDTWDREGMLRIAREMKAMGVRAAAVELQNPGGRGRGHPAVFFRQGQSYGLWQMALQAAEVTSIEATPQEWRKAHGVQVHVTKAKKGPPQTEEEVQENAARLKSQRDLGLVEVVRKVMALFPGVDLRATELARVPSPDFCVAVLLCLFAAGVRSDGAKARKITPEEAAAELERERQAKARLEGERRKAKEQKEAERKAEQERKRAERERAKSEKERVKAERKAERERKRVERENKQKPKSRELVW